MSADGSLTLHGRVVSGLGVGAGFTQLDWARRQFIAEFGIDPHPGTLNLQLDSAVAGETWARIRHGPCHRLLPDQPGGCGARGYPVRLAGRLPAAIIVPEVPGYPEQQLELISAVPLRRTLALQDGQRLEVEASRPVAVRAVIFDVDGTLIDTLEAYRVVADLAATPLGLTVTRDQVREALNSNRLFWELVVPERHPDRAGTLERMRKAAYAAWPQVIQQHAAIYPGLAATLADLQQRGILLGVVTGSRLHDYHPLRQQGLLEPFGAIVTGLDDVRAKPDPEGLLRCAEALGIEPNEALYVGDSPIDITASLAAGMTAVAVLTGAGDSAQLSAAGAHWILPSHRELGRVLAM